jgi:SAM-dependent methyltransferase
MLATQNGAEFDHYYFATGCGSPYVDNDAIRDLFDRIAQRIIKDINPTSVLDAGCAIGYLVEAFRAHGVEADGVDLSEYAISKARPGAKPYCWVGSVAEPFPKKYDLIVCTEILEHMSSPDADRAVVNLCRHSKDILFSSTPYDFKEATHYNVRPPEYWAEKFAQEEFYADVEFDTYFLYPWAFRFRQGYQPIPRVLAAYERRATWLRQQVDGIRQTALELRNELAQKDARFKEQERLCQEVVREREQMERERNQAERERHRLNAVLTSRSWRLTAPVRKVLSWVKGER